MMMESPPHFSVTVGKKKWLTICATIAALVCYHLVAFGTETARFLDPRPALKSTMPEGSTPLESSTGGAFYPIETSSPVADNNKVERIAIVFKTKTIDHSNNTCLCERFVALVEGTTTSGREQKGNKQQGTALRSYDIILLHEPGEKINPSLLEWIDASPRHRDRVKVLSNPIASTYLDVRANGIGMAAKGKLSFLLWIHELHLNMGVENNKEQPDHRRYDHYWLVEDDVFWTGEWGHFFETNDRRFKRAPEAPDNKKNNNTKSWSPPPPSSLSPDYVVLHFFDPKSKRWYHGETCRIHGNLCYDQDDNIGRSFNNLFRISDRFASYLLELIFRGALEGHDEAIFMAALQAANAASVAHNNNNIMMTTTDANLSLSKNNDDDDDDRFPSFTLAQLFADESREFKGLDTLGGWSAWDGNTKQAVYSLSGIAEIYRSCHSPSCDHRMTERIHELANAGFADQQQQAANNSSVLNDSLPRNKIFHPVKCPADPTIGVAALAFATGEKSLESPITSALQSACRRAR